jgi:hypothetical protein
MCVWVCEKRIIRGEDVWWLYFKMRINERKEKKRKEKKEERGTD